MSGPVTPVTPTEGSSVSSANFSGTIILNRVYSLLLEVLQSLQRAAVAQSDRLNVLTDWQKAYSDLLDQVHTFVKSNGDGIDGSATNEMTARDDLNRLNSSFTEMMKNRRSLISDDAKALQSFISQSNDAINQQLTMGTSFIQTISGLTSSIWR